MKPYYLALLALATVLAAIFALPTFAEPQPPGCLTDANCAVGQVCEPTASDCSASSRQCVPGCRLGFSGSTTRGCTGGQSCVDGGTCITCPCPDNCRYIGIDPVDPDLTLRVDGSNPNNPYDTVGQLHNAALDSAIELRDTLGSDPEILGLAMLEKIRDVGCAASGDAPCDLRLPGIAVARLLAKPEQVRAEIAASMTSAQSPYFERLMSAVEDHEAGISQQLDQLRELETEMQDALRSEESADLLKAASVARHSLVYWHAQRQGNSPWHLDPQRVDDATFDELTQRIPAFDTLGGFGHISGHHPVDAAIASMFALCFWIISLFL